MANLSTETMKMVRSRPFRSRFIALSAILDHPLPTYTKERLKSILTDRAISENLAPMLASLNRFDLSISSIVPGRVVEQFLALEPNEKEYIAAIRRGELLPQLLFTAGSEDDKRITEHPAILWKVVNVRNYLRRQSKKHPGDSSHHGASEGGSGS